MGLPRLHRRGPRICGIYAILGPVGVYVGQSADIFRRQTVSLANRLGLSWGIVQELSASSTFAERLAAEWRVRLLFEERGFVVPDRMPRHPADDEPPLVTRPKTRTAQLDSSLQKEVKDRFGTWKNAYATIAPTGMTMDVFTRVVAGRPSNPPEVVAVRAAFDAWKKANLK